MRLSSLFRCLALLAVPVLNALSADEDCYVGTYTKKGGSEGIYHFRLNTETGALSGGELAAEAKNPTFLAAHPRGHFLYAASENSPGAQVLAYAIEANGALKLLNAQSARGDGVCHVSIDAAGRYAFVANYGGGSVAALPIGADGRLGEATGFVQHLGSSVNPQRQKEPHAHGIYPEPAGRFVYACDLGTDKIYGYRFDAATGALTADPVATATLAPGSGPRHLAFHPTAPWVYAINELLNTVTAFQRSATTGALQTLQTISALPANSSGPSSGAEICVHPNGKFVYASNRGNDSIVVFQVGEDGRLTLLQHASAGGKGPRHFTLDPAGRFLLAAHQDSNNLVVFRVDPDSGRLTSLDQSVSLNAPVCVVFPPKL